jgi:hypothetical protein
MNAQRRVGAWMGIGILVNYLDRVSLSVAAPQLPATRILASRAECDYDNSRAHGIPLN